MLRIEGIHTYYGASYVLQGLSLEVKEGSVVGLLGRNGMGKTTTIRSIIGLTPPRRGAIYFKERNISCLQPYRIARLGIGWVPQGKRIFASLSVEENLTMCARPGDKANSWSLETVYSIFPVLQKRARNWGNQLSGGEQQMLAISRAMMTNPDLLLLDEPSEGLAPRIVLEISDLIRLLKKSGLSVLLVEQNIPMALELADYIFVVNKGSVAHHCLPKDLLNDEEVKAKYLGVGGEILEQ
jgi:branched-chain amino acid transport system ATP-binding protein